LFCLNQYTKHKIADVMPSNEYKNPNQEAGKLTIAAIKNIP
jgi:hypothetical protein